MKLYAYYRSSTSFRVRIALNLKGCDYEIVPVNLLKGAHKQAPYQSLNPFQSVPTLEMDGVVYAQSLAIIDALERTFPTPSFLPEKEADKALCQKLAYAIATEVHAPNNLKTLNYLKNEMGQSEESVGAWYRHWISEIFRPVEAELSGWTVGDFPFGAPGFFEIILVPQIYNGLRFGLDMQAFPKLNAVYQTCLTHEAFARAHPSVQPDTPTEQ